MRSVRAAMTAGVVLACFAALPANARTDLAPEPRAASVQVLMKDDFYKPRVIEGVVDIMGVHFANQGTEFHNVLLDPGPAWFTTNLDEGESDDAQLTYAGTFPFRCTYHDEMTGVFKVKPMAPMNSGNPGDTFTIEVAALDPVLDGYHFNVQRRRNDGAWKPSADVTTATFDFTPTKAGKYDLRVRLVDAEDHSSWSPSVRIRVS